MARRSLAAAAACALLAACAGPPPPTIRAKGVTPVTGASLSQPLPPEQPAPQPAAPPDAQAAPTPPAAAPEVAAVPRPAPAAPARHGKGPKPEQIVDHPGRAVRALLGAPDLQRREPPAEVWQYAGEACVLDITFYPARDGGAARAAYLESRAIDGSKLAPAVCLGSLGRVTED